MNVDLSDLDQVIELLPKVEIVTDRGFTINDLARRLQIPRPTAARKLNGLLQDGKVQVIGYRPGSGKEKVYEVSTKKAHENQGN